jgi:hypothetical protein
VARTGALVATAALLFCGVQALRGSARTRSLPSTKDVP